MYQPLHVFHRPRPIYASILAVLIVLAAGAARADTANFLETTDNYFDNPANWDTVAVPGNADWAVLDSSDNALARLSHTVGKFSGDGGLTIWSTFTTLADSSIGVLNLDGTLNRGAGVNVTVTGAMTASLGGMTGQGTTTLLGTGSANFFSFDGNVEVAGNLSTTGELGFNRFDAATPGNGVLVVLAGGRLNVVDNQRLRAKSFTGDPFTSARLEIRPGGSADLFPSPTVVGGLPDIRIEVPTQNDGTITIHENTATFYANSTHAAGASVTGTGTAAIAGGIHDFLSGSSLSVAALKIIGGVVNLHPGSDFTVPTTTVSGNTANLNVLAGRALLNVHILDVSLGGKATFDSDAVVEFLKGNFHEIGGAGRVEIFEFDNGTGYFGTHTGLGVTELRRNQNLDNFQLTLDQGRTLEIYGTVNQSGPGAAFVIETGSKAVVKAGGSWNADTSIDSPPQVIAGNPGDNGKQVLIETLGIFRKSGSGTTDAIDANFQVAQGGTFAVTQGTLLTRSLESRGSVSIDALAKATAESVIIGSGTLIVDGNLETNTLTVFSDIPGFKTLFGGRGSVRSSAGDLAVLVGPDVSVSPGDSPGTLTIEGSYFQDVGAELLIELSGTAPGEFDVLAVTGNAELHGLLKIIRFGTYAPQVGDSFLVLTYGSHTGEFDSVLLEGFGPGIVFDQTWGANGLTLDVAAVPEPATWLTLLAGLGVVGFAVRRRRA